MNLIIEVIGWIGTVILLGTYFCLTRGWLRQEQRLYHALNVIGAIAVGIAAFDKSNHQTVVIEIVFGGIALAAAFNPPKPEGSADL